MTDKAKKRRRELAKELGVSMRTAANIIKKRTEERRRERAKATDEPKEDDR